MISVVIPAFKERAIAEVVASVEQALEPLGSYEILVVDDGSDDDTGERAAAAGATVLRHPTNIGYGNALKTGIRAARYPLIAILDGDATYPAERLPDFLAEIDRGFDLVVGARADLGGHDSLFKGMARWIFNRVAEFVAGHRIADVNSGMRLFRRAKIMPFLGDLSGSFSFTTSQTLIFFSQGCFVKYLPIEYRKRSGESKVRLGRDTLRAAQILVQTILLYNPIKLFLIAAILHACGAVASFGLYLLWPRWEVFATALTFVLLTSLSLFFGFLTYPVSQRARDVRNLRPPEP